MPMLPPDVTTDPELADDVQRFRAPTFDEAVALANAELGEHLEIVEANRIRRGGLGGFFATDLGVEVAARAVRAASVERPDPELGTGSAIERLMARAESEERAAAMPHDFAAALARELGDTAPMPQTTEAWSDEAYRRLAIPKPVDRPPVVPAPPAPAPKQAASRPTAGRDVAARLAEVVREAADHANQPLDLPVLVSGPVSGEPDMVELVNQAAAALFGQINAMAAADQARVAHVRKLNISVTSPTGHVIEISAELD